MQLFFDCTRGPKHHGLGHSVTVTTPITTPVTLHCLTLTLRGSPTPTLQENRKQGDEGPQRTPSQKTAYHTQPISIIYRLGPSAKPARCRSGPRQSDLDSCSRAKWPSIPHFQHLIANQTREGLARQHVTSSPPLTGTAPPGSLSVRRFFRASRVVISRAAGEYKTATPHTGPASSSICNNRAHDGGSRRFCPQASKNRWPNQFLAEPPPLFCSLLRQISLQESLQYAMQAV